MRRVKRLKEAIARLERETAATEAQLEEEFEHGYAAGFNAGRAEMDTKLRDLIAEISLQAAFTGKDVADLPEHVAGLRALLRSALKAAQNRSPAARLSEGGA